MKKLLLAACFLGGLVQTNAQTMGTMKDARDGKTYATVTIGDQTWMAQNLNYKASGSYYNAENPSSKYGRHYTWSAAKKACPSGWHLPTDKEWQQLATHLGVPENQLSTFGWMGTDEGKTLRSKEGWLENGNGNNITGFNGLPSGERYSDDGTFGNLGYRSYYWTATEHDADVAYYYSLYITKDGIFRNGKEKTNMYSCRCVKN